MADRFVSFMGSVVVRARFLDCALRPAIGPTVPATTPPGVPAPCGKLQRPARSIRRGRYRHENPTGGRRLPPVDAGTRVEVRSRFDRRWSRGFEVVEEIGAGEHATYRIRRRSDGSVLPSLFDAGEVREERTKSDMWWI